MAPYSEIVFERLAVTEEQIIAWDLPSRPTKTSDPRARRFGDRPSVELEAIEPNQLRALVQAAIERHQPPDVFAELKAEEARERVTLLKLVKKMTPKRE
jgi:hypothetical protein